jgi:3-hydroxyisobutyrate dehydrogenase-like beta-hydroxyacid dehydrogenase
MGFKVAFLGLGVMGYPMAAYLAKAGHEVTVYNRNPAKAEKWVAQHRGKRADTPTKAAIDQDFVFACVGNDDDLRQICIGINGAFHGMKPSSIFIDHTTASAKIARELFRHAQNAGFGFIDAPVSGGQAGAEKGQLTVMCGGTQADFDQSKEVISAFAKAVTLMGESGTGQLTKMMNQVCIASLLQGLSEALKFGMNAGLDTHKALEVISQGSAQSWQMDHRGKSMVEGKFDFGFAVDWMRKDLSLVLDEARRNGSQLPVTALVDQFYAEVQSMGGQRWDTSSLIKRL